MELRLGAHAISQAKKRERVLFHHIYRLAAVKPWQLPLLNSLARLCGLRTGGEGGYQGDRRWRYGNISGLSALDHPSVRTERSSF